MKKLILSVTMLAIAATTIFVACKKGEEKKETNVSSNKPTNNLNRQIDGLNINMLSAIANISSHPKLQTIIATTHVTNDLSIQGFSIYPSSNVETHVDAVTGNKVYTIALQSTIATTHAALVIQPMSEFHDIYKVYVVKKSSVGEETTFIKVIGETGFTPVGMVGDKHWRSCMVAAWNDVTSDLSGTLACALVPEVCIAACLISCANAITVPECISPTKSKSEALACLCALNILDCTKTVSESTITFTTPL